MIWRMLEELHAAMERDEFLDAEGSVSIDAVEWGDGETAVIISLRVPEVVSCWRIGCRKVRDVRIGNSMAEYVLLEAEHVLLWPHRGPLRQLYYRGRPVNRHAVLGELMEVHREIVGEWFGWDRFLNPLTAGMKQLDGGYGLFATGPAALIDAYDAVLRKNGIGTSFLAYPSRWWDGNNWVEEEGNIRALIIGDSYVIASDFVLTRLP